MVRINTVLGSIDSSEMGFTLTHEHITNTSAGLPQVFPEFVDRKATATWGVTSLREAYAEGLRTMVDVTTIDLGRDIKLMREVSRRSKVNLIPATGTWRDIPRAFWNLNPDVVAGLYVREIKEGIEGTDIKAGVIKVATDRGGVTPEGEVILRAAARASKRTGVPISTHTWAPERVGEQQVKIFEEEGVDLNRVYIGHSNDTTDTDYLIGLLKRGVWIGMDRYPGGRLAGSPDWQARTGTVKRLIDAGFGHRVMLSHDWFVTMTIANKEQVEQRKQYNPDGYLFIKRRVLPRLRELGATERDVQRLMVDNPRRFFEGKK